MYRQCIGLVGAGLLAISGSAVASTVDLGGVTYYVQSGASVTGTDCAGALGNPPNCNINPAFDEDISSPLIAKYDWVTEDEEGNPVTPYWAFTQGAFPSITADDFTVTGGGNQTGEFTYNADVGDPFLRYWVVKAGNQWRAFWLTADEVNTGPTFAVRIPVTGTDCNGAPCTIQWSSMVQQGLSHITFYDTGSAVPLPAAAWLLGSGLLGLFAVGRRRKGAQVAAA